VLLVFLCTAQAAAPDGSKSHNQDIVPAVLEGLAQADPQNSAKGEKSGTPSRTSPGDSDMKAVPKKPKETSPPFEDFVPSEKIDADKAVDFPVDI
jgi:hypothetical protein